MKKEDISTVLVTGGAGYVGCVLVPKLLDKGYNVKVVDLYMYGEDVLKEVSENPRLEQIKGDIRDKKLLKEKLSGCDAVIHLACVSNDPSFELNPDLSRSINYDCFSDLVDISKSSGVERFIYVSTCSVYGISDAEKVTEEHPLVPLTDYNKYKGMCEPVLLEKQSEDFTTTIIRPATICGYSPRLRLDLIVNRQTSSAFNNGRIEVWGGKQTRPNIHIEDITGLYSSLLELDKKLIAGKVYNAGGENLTIEELARRVKNTIQEAFNKTVDVVTTYSDDVRSYRISSEKIEHELGFKPKKKVEDAVKELFNSFKEGKVKNHRSSLYYNVERMKEIQLK